MSESPRPNILRVKNADEFLTWYWLKEDMVQFCKAKGLNSTGKKFDLRDRIVAFFNNQVQKPQRKKSPKSRVNWAKASLSLDTKITDGVTFGKNFRGFMAENIGSNFVCHSDFMDWVKSNQGATLADAVNAWWTLEERKSDPAFKRKIAPQNMLAQYTRDFFDDNPHCSRQQMMSCWKHKKELPAKGGKVFYERDDRKWIW